MTIKVGDRVRIVSTLNSFSSFHSDFIGQEGVVERVGHGCIDIAGNNLIARYLWDIRDVELVNSNPYSRVIRKIQEMKARREALGYKY